ncbi:MAG TPA: S8 family serine peptidase [Candidatus Eisenbacteria bacterium]
MALDVRVAHLGRVAALLLLAAPAGAAVPPAGAAKLDPRLARAVATGAVDTLPVWVEFQDKGETGPGSLARKLDEARAALAPRALARRLRAHVEPLVDYRDIPVWTPYLDALAARGIAPTGVSRWFNRAAVHVPPARLAEIAALPFVRRLEPVERARRMQDPPAPPLGLAPPGAGPERAQEAMVSYGLTNPEIVQLNLPPVHALGYTGAGVLVCFLDDGYNFYMEHSATKNQVIAPGRVRDFVDGDWNVQDTTVVDPVALKHGTWTFSTAGGNDFGTFVGSGYGAQYALGRTENDFSEHMVEMVYWGQGAEWADSMGADIISSSLGYTTFDLPDTSYTYADMNGHTTIITRAAEIAASKGILVVNAAGNEGASAWHYIDAPADANGDSLIAVGAVDLSGTLASFSSRGPTYDGRIKPDLCALGVSNPIPDVTSPLNPIAYTAANGTSFATPLVAGLAACLMQAVPWATPTEIIRALRATASRAGSPDDNYGYGIPNAYAALAYLSPAQVPPGGPLVIRATGPNPMRAGQVVVFQCSPGPSAGDGAAVSILDSQGRIVRHLWSGHLAPVGQPATWDGRDDGGRYVAPGLYFASLRAAQRQSSARVVFLR